MSIVSISGNTLKRVNDMIHADAGLKDVDMFTGEVNSVKSLIEKIEKLEEEKSVIMQDINDLFQIAKSQGHHVNALKYVIKLRKMDPDKLKDLDEMVRLYREQIGLK